MTDEKEYLTKEKFDALQDELNFLKTTRRKEIAENLEAREFQAATEDRINKLELILKSAKIVAHKSNDFVNLGSEVEIQKEKENETRKYKIVGSEEANMQERKISHISPLGEALMGKKKGETFSFLTPNGKLNCKIISIK